LVHFRNSARIYYEDKRDLTGRVEHAGKHVEVLAAPLEDVPDGQKVPFWLECCVLEVRIPGQHIHSAPLLHAVPRVVDEHRLWRRLLQFLQKVANTPLDSSAISQIRKEFCPAARESIDLVAQRLCIPHGIGKTSQDFILADADAQHRSPEVLPRRWVCGDFKS
jgi:hypothetical protein